MDFDFTIEDRHEGERGCGWRSAGGTYLVSEGFSAGCGKLPLPVHHCPTCKHGIRPAIGWTWFQPGPFFDELDCRYEGSHDPPTNTCDSCPMHTGADIGEAGLLWIGRQFYATPEDFLREGYEMGISRRVPSVPRGFKLGTTWVFFGHRDTIEEECPDCEGAGQVDAIPGTAEDLEGAQGVGKPVPCKKCKGTGKLMTPGIFGAYLPQRIEYVVKEDDPPEKLQRLKERGFTLVNIIRVETEPDDADTEHDPACSCEACVVDRAERDACTADDGKPDNTAPTLEEMAAGAPVPQKTEPTFVCDGCGKTLPTSSRQGEAMMDNDLCADCYERAGLENEHSDGHHDDGPRDGCPLCQKPWTCSRCSTENPADARLCTNCAAINGATDAGPTPVPQAESAPEAADAADEQLTNPEATEEELCDCGALVNGTTHAEDCAWKMELLMREECSPQDDPGADPDYGKEEDDSRFAPANGGDGVETEPADPPLGVPQDQRPACRLVGEDGNIFAVLGNARKALKRVGLDEKADEMVKRATDAGSYNAALAVVMEYVEVE